MTQWNDQAPLSRRQAREQERHGDGSQPASAVSAASPVEPEPSVALPFGSAAEPAAALPASAQQPGSAVDGSGGRSRGRRASGASVDGAAAAPGPSSVASAAEPGLRRRDARSRGAATAPPSREAASQAPEPAATEPAAPPVFSAFTAASAAEPGSRRARRAAEQARPEPQTPPAAPITDSQWAAVTQRGSAAEPGDRPAPSFWSDTAVRDAAPQPAPEWAPPALLPEVRSAAEPSDRVPAPPSTAPDESEAAPAESAEAAADGAPTTAAEPAGTASTSVDPASGDATTGPAPRRRGTWQAPEQAADPQQTTAPQPFPRRSEPAAPVEERPAPPAAETIVPPVGPGVGHWSRQSQSEDDTQSGTGAIGRGMGFATPLNSTNSLVLPSIPEPGGNLTGPLGGSGEVLLTGSMELPRSLGSSGADPRRYDTSEVDRLFETGDYEEVSTDSTPVLAARAISSHSATRGLVAAQKPRGSQRFPTALAIGAGVAALVVVGLFVVMVVTGVFTN